MNERRQGKAMPYYATATALVDGAWKVFTKAGTMSEVTSWMNSFITIELASVKIRPATEDDSPASERRSGRPGDKGMTRTFTRDDVAEIQAVKSALWDMCSADLISHGTYEQASAELVDRVNEAQALQL
jgi:hypothetical protein